MGFGENKNKKENARIPGNGRPERGATEGWWKESVCVGGRRKESMRVGGRRREACVWAGGVCLHELH